MAMQFDNPGYLLLTAKTEEELPAKAEAENAEIISPAEKQTFYYAGQIWTYYACAAKQRPTPKAP